MQSYWGPHGHSVCCTESYVHMKHCCAFFNQQSGFKSYVFMQCTSIKALEKERCQTSLFDRLILILIDELSSISPMTAKFLRPPS